MEAKYVSLTLGKDKTLVIDETNNTQSIALPHGKLFIFGTVINGELIDIQTWQSIVENPSTCADLDGHFSLCYVPNDASGTLKDVRVLGCRAGGNRIYLSGEDNHIIVSNSVKKGDKIALDFTSPAFHEVLNFRWNSSFQSICTGVVQVPCASYIDYSYADGVKECKRYYQLPLLPINEKSIDEHSAVTETLLEKAILKACSNNKKVAVLLSGGIDSSVLLAIAKNNLSDIVAVSHRSARHENPELDTAIRFAKELGVEHRIIDIDDALIPDAFIQTSKIIEQPIRYQSSVILYLLFKALADEFDQVLYGEAADTLFGSNLVKRFKIKKQKKEKISPMVSILPFHKAILGSFAQGRKVIRLVEETSQSFIDNEIRITYQKPLDELFGVQQNDLATAYSELNTEASVIDIKRYLMHTDIDNHFHETGCLANFFGLELVSPFVDKDVLNYALGIDDKAYIGTDFVKPVLRNIGTKYYTKELMYLPKKGFPAPHKVWLSECLKEMVTASQNHFNIVIDDSDTEALWTVASLYCLE